MDDESPSSYNLYRGLKQSTATVLASKPASHASFDFHRAQYAYEAHKGWHGHKKLTTQQIQSYLTNSPSPVAWNTITKKDFVRLQEQYDGSVFKINFIGGNVGEWLKKASPKEKILSVGGACALETMDIRHIDYFRKRPVYKKYVTTYIESMFYRFPTWTQVTGALLPARGISVFYDETFPWHYKVEAYGVQNAQALTQEVYDKTYRAVVRYSQLHHPQNNVIKLPFITLNLAKDGYLDRWFAMYEPYIREIEKNFGFEPYHYTPADYYRSWIEYTYNGPEILQLVLQQIKEQYPSLYKSCELKNCTIHIRGKQIDHFDVERHNKWIHDYSLSQKPLKDAKYKHLLSHPMHRHGLAMYMWMRDHQQDFKSTGSVGFLDQTYRGAIAHEFSLIKCLESTNKDEFFQELIETPLRLHSNNVSNVIKFLERFRKPYSVSFSNKTIYTFTKLTTAHARLERKIKKLDIFIDYSDKVIDIFHDLLSGQNTIDYQKVEMQEIITFLIERYKTENNLLDRYDRTITQKIRIEMLAKDLMSLFIMKEKDGKTTLSVKNEELLKLWQSLLITYNEKDKKRRNEYARESEQIQNEITNQTQNISEKIINQKADYLSKHVSILPLVDNIFFSYMEQLTFIPAIQEAYQDMVSIESSSNYKKEEKEKIIIDIINSIFNIVASCLTFVFKQDTSYPWQARFEARYKRPY